MKSFIISILLCMLLAGSNNCIAQQGHVYEDSSILYDQEPKVMEEQVEVVEAPQQDDYVETTTTYVRDTFLTNNRLFLSADSLNFLRKDKQFGYAKNLDSLLMTIRKKQEDEEAKKAARQNKENNNDRNIDIDDTLAGKPSFIESLFNSAFLQIVLWSLAGLFVLFVVYKLFFGAGVFQRSTAKSNVKIEEEPGEALPVPERKFDAAIKKAVSENNYRVAVRYLYLQLLQRLVAAGAIQFAVDKTNTEYLREISNKPYKDEVSELTRYYDYVWYGEFTLDMASYEKIENRFRNVVI